MRVLGIFESLIGGIVGPIVVTWSFLTQSWTPIILLVVFVIVYEIGKRRHIKKSKQEHSE